LVSVITVVKNAANTIRRTIQSVLHQEYDNLEYLVFDGASKDGTQEIVGEYGPRIAYWVSEPDRSADEAINKAIRQSNGEYVMFAFADDWIADPEYVSRAVAALTRSGADFVFGDLACYSGEQFMFVLKGDPEYALKIRSQMPVVNFPTFVIRRKCFDAVGLLDLRYKVSTDYEWLLRAHVRGFRGIYDGTLLGHFRLGGKSDRNYFQGLIEVRRAAIAHGCDRLSADLSFARRFAAGIMNRSARRLLPRALYATLRQTLV
jgi:glycosyltransferase involved in cell wall biosynthesis